jgi:hypothetical protein
MNAITLLLSLATASTLPSQQKNTDVPATKPDVVLRWNEAALETIKADRTPPPLAARNLAIVHIAVYDAVNAIERTHKPFRVEMNAPANTSAEVAAAVAAHRALVALYPKQGEHFDKLLDQCLKEVPAGAARTNGSTLGVAVADKVLAWRADDGANRKGQHTAGTAPGVWKPTPPGLKPALLPQWASVTPFAVADASKFRPEAPPALDSDDYAAALKEVRALGGLKSTTRTVEQTLIAWFWADEEGSVTPPGHWNRIAQTVAREKKTTTAENARLFALLNVALADAAIVCWDCKFKYSFWRPVTAIRAVESDWMPLIVTPPFPAYTSGHSTFSGAAATVLADFFNTDEIAFETDSDGLPGNTRAFKKFSAAAEEAGRSRIYGGIHYEFDNRQGLALGKAVGRHVTTTLLRPKDKD